MAGEARADVSLARETMPPFGLAATRGAGLEAAGEAWADGSLARETMPCFGLAATRGAGVEAAGEARADGSLVRETMPLFGLVATRLTPGWSEAASRNSRRRLLRRQWYENGIIAGGLGRPNSCFLRSSDNGGGTPSSVVIRPISHQLPESGGTSLGRASSDLVGDGGAPRADSRTKTLSSGAFDDNLHLEATLPGLAAGSAVRRAHADGHGRRGLGRPADRDTAD